MTSNHCCPTPIGFTSSFFCFLLLIGKMLPFLSATGQIRFQLALLNRSVVDPLATFRAELCAREFRWNDAPVDWNSSAADCKFGWAQLTMAPLAATDSHDLNSQSPLSSSSKVTAALEPFSHSWRQSFSFSLRLWHGDELVLHRSERVFLLPAGSGWRSMDANFSTLGQQNGEMEQQWQLELRFRVDCAPNFYGAGCDVRCELTDWERRLGRMECDSDGKKGCASGWTGPTCSFRAAIINGSALSSSSSSSSSSSTSSSSCPCANGGKCAEDGGQQRCLCPPGYRGPRCQFCVAHSRCKGFCRREKPGGCACPEGKGGQFCEKDLVFCTRNSPCQHGGTCLNGADGGYTCQCPPGFAGHDCERRLASCADQPCQNGADCVPPSHDGGSGFRCECPPGVHGRFCQVRALGGCSDQPCQNGGSCADLALLAVVGGLSAAAAAAGRTSSPPSSSSLKCLCADGWTGPVCDQPWEHCAAGGNACQNGASCLLDPNGPLGFQCICPLGWQGPFCATSTDDCAGQPCLNGGTCLDEHNAFRCVCPSGVEGELCEQQQTAGGGRRSGDDDHGFGLREVAASAGQPSPVPTQQQHPSPPALLSLLLLLLLLAAIALLALSALLCLLRRLPQQFGWPLLGGGGNFCPNPATFGQEAFGQEASAHRSPAVALIGDSMHSSKPWGKEKQNEADETSLTEYQQQQPRYVPAPVASNIQIGRMASVLLEEQRRLQIVHPNRRFEDDWKTTAGQRRQRIPSLASSDPDDSAIYEDIDGGQQQQRF